MKYLLDTTTSALFLGLGFVIAYLVVLWLATAFFVWRDATQRSASLPFQLFALLLGAFPPFLGTAVYLVIRPRLTLDEARAFALEEQTLLDSEPDVLALRPCPSCGKELEPEFVVCPYCRTQFARRCENCQQALRLGWSICPYCAHVVGTTAPRIIRRVK